MGRLRVGQCAGCEGWGELVQPPYCSPCHQIRSKRDRREGACRRCSRTWLVNQDGLCRPCVEAVVANDAAWYFDPPSSPRPVQLALIFHGLPKRTARPFGTYRARSDGRYHPPQWARDQLPQPTADDPRVLPPTSPGQLLLIERHERIEIGLSARIRDRVYPGFDAAAAQLEALITEGGYTGARIGEARDVVRLALAVAATEGKPRVDDAVLAFMPGHLGTVAEALRRAGLLDPDCGPRSRPRPRAPRPADHDSPQSCTICGVWGIRRTCYSCQRWASLHPGPGVCARCRHPADALRDGWCRTCLVHVLEYGPAARGQGWSQLRLADEVVGRPARPFQQLGRGSIEPGTARAAPARIAFRASAERSPHQLVPGQASLFPVRRDWANATDKLQRYALSPESIEAMRRLAAHGEEQGWSRNNQDQASQTLRTLLGWLGAAAPIPEQDIRSLSKVGLKTRRVLRFLEDERLVISDPSRQSEPREHAVARIIASLPATIASELEEWAESMREVDGRGRPRATYRTISAYLAYAYPALTEWGRRYRTLREVTPGDVDAVVAARRGGEAHRLGTALRSIFRTLKRNKTIFRDPTAGMVVPAGPQPPPRALPREALAGLIDRAPGAAARLAVALVAIHAVGQRELTRITLSDLSLTSGRLTVHRRNGPRDIHLDDVTAVLADLWLRERHERWPATRNQHLFISQQTAAESGPVAVYYLWRIFEPLGINHTQLRRDRLLDEARATADPVHLMRVFGVTADTALKYIYTAHPDKRPANLG